jgi:CRISPR-associated protein Csd2
MTEQGTKKISDNEFKAVVLPKSPAVANRYDFVFLFDCKNGNPNGDPDSDNSPRINPYTEKGIITDVCLKRKVRDYIEMTSQGKIFIQNGVWLNRLIKEARNEAGIPDGNTDTDTEKVKMTQAMLLAKYWDIRCFGGVLMTGPNAGQVRGPVTFSISDSIDMIYPMSLTITRVADTDDGVQHNKLQDYIDAEKKAADSGKRSMGRKRMVDYGLYRMHGSVSAYLCERTNFTEEDLMLLWEAMENMFEHAKTASSGLMAVRKLVLFKHVGTANNDVERANQAKKGVAHSNKLCESVIVKRNDGVEHPASFEDYTITVPTIVPAGVEMIVRV